MIRAGTIVEYHGEQLAVSVEVGDGTLMLANGDIVKSDSVIVIDKALPEQAYSEPTY